MMQLQIVELQCLSLRACTLGLAYPLHPRQDTYKCEKYIFCSRMTLRSPLPSVTYASVCVYLSRITTIMQVLHA